MCVEFKQMNSMLRNKNSIPLISSVLSVCWQFYNGVAMATSYTKEVLD